MLEPRPDCSPLGVNFKILDEHHYLFELFFLKKITLSRRLWYARVGLYVTPIRFGLLSTLTANQITDSKCVSSVDLVAAIFCTGTKYFLKY